MEGIWWEYWEIRRFFYCLNSHVKRRKYRHILVAFYSFNLIIKSG